MLRLLLGLTLLSSMAIAFSGLAVQTLKLRRDDCAAKVNDPDCINEFSDVAFNATYDDLQNGQNISTYDGLDYIAFMAAAALERPGPSVEPHSPALYAQSINASSRDISTLPAMTATAGAVVFKLKTFYWACGYEDDLNGTCSLSIGGYNPSQNADHPLELAGGPVNFNYEGGLDEACQSAYLSEAVMPEDFIFNTYIFNLTRCGQDGGRCELLLDDVDLVAYSLDELQDK